MAELAIAAFSAMSSVFTGGTAAAGAAGAGAAAAGAGAAAATGGLGASLAAGVAGAGATTAAATTAGIGSSLFTGLQTVASIGGMISTLVSGVSGMQSANMQARMATLEGSAEQLAAEEKALRIRREYVQKIGATRVAFAGSGIDISGGYAIEDSLASQTDFETGLTLKGGQMAQTMAGLRASQYRSQGESKLVAAAMKGLKQGADLGLDIINRG